MSDDQPEEETIKQPVRISICPKCHIVYMNDEPDTPDALNDGFCPGCGQTRQVRGVFRPDTPPNNLVEDSLDRLAQAADKVPDLPDDILDDIVHELASSIGSDTNNGGFDSQARFILEQMGIQAGEKAIQEILDEEIAKSIRPDPSAWSTQQCQTYLDHTLGIDCNTIGHLADDDAEGWRNEVLSRWEKAPEEANDADEDDEEGDPT